MANYEMIDNEIKKDIHLCFNRSSGAGDLLFKKTLENSENVYLKEIISINNDEVFQSFVEFWEPNRLALTPFSDTLQAKCTYKIFFMFFAEALSEEDRNNPYIRIIDIKNKYGDFRLPPVDFNDPQIIAKINMWLAEIPNNA